MTYFKIASATKIKVIMLVGYFASRIFFMGTMLLRKLLCNMLVFMQRLKQH